MEEDRARRRPGNQSLDGLHDEREARRQPEEQESGPGWAMGECREQSSHIFDTTSGLQ